MNKDKPYLVIEHQRSSNSYTVLGEKGYNKDDAETFAHERAEISKDNEVLVAKVIVSFAVNKPQVKRFEYGE
jgi:hypothetical protein